MPRKNAPLQRSTRNDLARTTKHNRPQLVTLKRPGSNIKTQVGTLAAAMSRTAFGGPSSLANGALNAAADLVGSGSERAAAAGVVSSRVVRYCSLTPPHAAADLVDSGSQRAAAAVALIQPLAFTHTRIHAPSPPQGHACATRPRPNLSPTKSDNRPKSQAGWCCARCSPCRPNGSRPSLASPRSTPCQMSSVVVTVF